MNAIGLVLASDLATPADVAAWALAVRGQLRNHVAPAWGITAPILTLYESLLDVPADVPLVLLVDNSDRAGALGYHTETPDGRPYGRVFLRDALLEGSAPSTVLSHEAVELALNPDVNRWAASGRGDDLWAWEACDAVQADSYMYRGVRVSNFVLPAFFDAHPPTEAPRVRSELGQFDYMGRLSGPFSLSPGGYTVLRTGGVLRQAYAMSHAPSDGLGQRGTIAFARPGDESPCFAPSKLAPGSRTQRLLRGPCPATAHRPRDPAPRG
jgi:hypothetical protein